MALASTITLNASSVGMGHPFNATVTITNDAAIPVTITSITPTCVEAGSTIDKDATAFSKTWVPLTQSFNHIVPASGSKIFPFSMCIHKPTGGSSSSVYTGPQLGAADSFALLAGSAITGSAGSGSTITGDIGVSPGSAISNFPPSTATGSTNAGNALAAAAQAALTIAYNNAAGRTGATDLTGQDLGTLTLLPGVYSFSSSAQLTGTLTLDAAGDASGVWIFQIGSTLTTAASAVVSMINGGIPGNVFWQVGSSATIGIGSTFKGNILAQVSITDNGGGTLQGRLLARTGAVTLATDTTISIALNSSQSVGSGAGQVSCMIAAADGQNLYPSPASITVLSIP